MCDFGCVCVLVVFEEEWFWYVCCDVVCELGVYFGWLYVVGL